MTEEFIEMQLRAIRSSSLEEARELLMYLIADVRARALLDAALAAEKRYEDAYHSQ